jgi:hypothetical protein
LRLWSIHPKYLDKSGFTALWREGLLAQKVLIKGEYSEKRSMCYTQNGQPKGYYYFDRIKTPYYNHPQLNRFKISNNPIVYMGNYLVQLAIEAFYRGYNFNEGKIFKARLLDKLQVTQGQIDYEVRHLQKKLLSRDFKKCCLLSKDKLNNSIKTHPIFKIIPGPIEAWEKV